MNLSIREAALELLHLDSDQQRAALTDLLSLGVKRAVTLKNMAHSIRAQEGRRHVDPHILTLADAMACSAELLAVFSSLLTECSTLTPRVSFTSAARG